MLTGDELHKMLAAMREFGVTRYKHGDLEIEFGREWAPHGAEAAARPSLDEGDPGIAEAPGDDGTADLGLSRDDVDFAHVNGVPSPPAEGN